jgi:protease-4
MRMLLTLVSDLFRALLSLLGLPGWLMRRRQRFFLVVELRGSLPWRAARRRRWPFAGGKRPLGVSSLKKLSDVLAKAEKDSRVLGAVIRVEGYEGPSATLAAVRRSLERFRAAGKRVVFYGRAVTMREYALMTCGDRVQLAPGGRLDLKGYSAELMVLGGALEKVGVKAHFLRRAQYKTAPEMFTDREVSPAQKETTRALLEAAMPRRWRTSPAGAPRRPSRCAR